jgi:hypothetical protein
MRRGGGVPLPRLPRAALASWAVLALACSCALRGGGARAQAPDDSARWADGGNASSVFLPDLPAFAASATVRAEADATRQRCGAASENNVTRLYEQLERVFVFHWNSLQLNGLGNTLGYYTVIMGAAALHGRAGFSSRNSPVCGPHPLLCRMNPALYLAGRGGFSWDWNAASAGAVRAAMAARGHAEVPFVFDDASVAIINNVTGERLSGGKHSVASFLSHPAVAQLPWVSLHLPPEPRIFKINGMWLAEDAAAGANATTSRPGGDVWEWMVGGRPSGLAWQNLTASRGVADAFCLCATFVQAAPRLQEALAPHVAKLDAVRAAGGGAAGVHVRSGYADFVVQAGALEGGGAEHRGTDESEHALKVRMTAPGTRARASAAARRARRWE